MLISDEAMEMVCACLVTVSDKFHSNMQESGRMISSSFLKCRFIDVLFFFPRFKLNDIHLRMKGTTLCTVAFALTISVRVCTHDSVFLSFAIT